MKNLSATADFNFQPSSKELLAQDLEGVTGGSSHSYVQALADNYQYDLKKIGPRAAMQNHNRLLLPWLAKQW
jgi:hypothetical protein